LDPYDEDRQPVGGEIFNLTLNTKYLQAVGRWNIACERE